jgi:hypothetical protein
MLYRITAHISPASEQTDPELDDLRRGLDRSGVETAALGVEEIGGRRWLHVESSVEAISGYDARRIAGLVMFERALSEGGLRPDAYDIGISLTTDDHRIEATAPEQA